MKKIQQKVFILLGLYYCAMMGMITGCTSTPTVTIGQPTKQPSGPMKPYFGKGATIHVTEYNAITMRPGDTITLSFPCQVAPPKDLPQGIGMEIKEDKVKLWTTIDTNPAVAKGNGANQPGMLSAQTLTVTFPSPQFTFMVYTDPNLELWPGDANADGYRNMLDLYAIAAAIKEAVVLNNPVTGSTNNGCTLPQQLSYPPNGNGDMAYLYPACAWGTTFEWEGQTIDFMHADCNIDGEINELDAQYLRAVMDPMYLPEFLKSAIDGVSLTATYAPDPSGPILPLTASGNFVVRLPFDIAFATNPNSPTVLDTNFFGVIFSRPVAESPQYKLLDTRLDFGNSGIFDPDPSATVWRQKFWPDFKLDYADGVCADASDRVLDVGAFRLGDPPTNPAAPLRIGQCQVTLDDILRPAGGGNPSTLFQLIQHTVNGLLFLRNEDGIVVPQTIECSTDTTNVDLSEICDVHDILLRDGNGDDASLATTTEPNAWSSPDIWVRHKGGPANTSVHQQPINGQEEEVYVRVFNRSCKTSKAATVDVYWTYANTHESWNDFQGHHIGQASIPEIPAFGQIVVMLPWAPVFEAAANPTSCGTMFSLLAVLSSQYDPVTIPLTTDHIHNWVLSANNVAMRSTYAINAARNATCAMISLRPEADAITLVLEQVAGPSQLPASHFGDLTLQLNGYNGNPSLQGMVHTGPQRYSLSPDATKGSLALGTVSGNPSMQISFEPRSQGPVLPQLTTAQYYAFRVYTMAGGLVQNSSIVEFTVR